MPSPSFASSRCDAGNRYRPSISLKTPSTSRLFFRNSASRVARLSVPEVGGTPWFKPDEGERDIAAAVAKGEASEVRGLEAVEICGGSLETAEGVEFEAGGRERTNCWVVRIAPVVRVRRASTSGAEDASLPDETDVRGERGVVSDCAVLDEVEAVELDEASRAGWNASEGSNVGVRDEAAKVGEASPHLNSKSEV